MEGCRRRLSDCALYPSINEAGKDRRGHEELAVLCIIVGAWLRGDDFVKREALLLESRHLFTERNQHVAIFGQLRFIADGSMARNDDGLRADRGVDFASRADHAVDAAAG